jgi:ribosomal small subunit protein bTHX
MGKGDKSSRRGKLFRGTHGKTRPAGKKKRPGQKQSTSKSKAPGAGSRR